MAIQDTDLLLINRGGASYKVTASEIKQVLYRFSAPLSSQSLEPPDYNVIQTGSWNGGSPTSASVPQMFNANVNNQFVFNDVNPGATISFDTPPVRNQNGKIILRHPVYASNAGNAVYSFNNSPLGYQFFGNYNTGAETVIDVSSVLTAGTVIERMQISHQNGSGLGNTIWIAAISLSGISGDYAIGPDGYSDATILNFPAGTDMRLISPGDTITQASGASGVVFKVDGTKVTLTSSSGTWVNGETVLGAIS